MQNETQTPQKIDPQLKKAVEESVKQVANWPINEKAKALGWDTDILKVILKITKEHKKKAKKVLISFLKKLIRELKKVGNEENCEKITFKIPIPGVFILRDPGAYSSLATIFSNDFYPILHSAEAETKIKKIEEIIEKIRKDDPNVTFALTTWSNIELIDENKGVEKALFNPYLDVILYGNPSNYRIIELSSCIKPVTLPPYFVKVDTKPILPFYIYNPLFWDFDGYLLIEDTKEDQFFIPFDLTFKVNGREYKFHDAFLNSSLFLRNFIKKEIKKGNFFVKEKGFIILSPLPDRQVFCKGEKTGKYFLITPITDAGKELLRNYKVGETIRPFHKDFLFELIDKEKLIKLMGQYPSVANIVLKQMLFQ